MEYHAYFIKLPKDYVQVYTIFMTSFHERRKFDPEQVCNKTYYEILKSQWY